MTLRKINVLLLFSFLCVITTSSQSRFPTKRWLTLCNSSKTWANNKTIVLRDFLKDNLDTLYL
jgi:hypothetical protein